jgi:hypothetical protein
MFAYQEVLKEMRDIIIMKDLEAMLDNEYLPLNLTYFVVSIPVKLIK